MWDVKYLPEALDDLDELDGSQRKLVLKSGEITLPEGTEMVMPGDNVTITVELWKIAWEKRKYGFNWVLENQIKSIWTKVGI